MFRCVDALEAWRIIEEIHKEICGMHANGHKMSRQIMRVGYYWLTLENNCIQFAWKCHKCQIHVDKIYVSPIELLHIMTIPWPFSMWGMDVIGPIISKSLNWHKFIFVVIDYFTKWVETTSYASITRLVICKFIKTKIICRYGLPKKIILNNALNLNNKMMEEVCA